MILVFSQGVLTMPSALAGDGYSISGKVLDGDGKPLEGVDIYVYDRLKVDVSETLDGYYLFKASTNERGIFRFNVDRSTYRLVFRKRGYKTRSETVSFTTKMHIKLGKIELEEAVRLGSIASYDDVKPGRSIIIPFKVYNDGEGGVEIGLQLRCPEGWEGHISDDIGQVNSLYLPPESSSSLNVEAYVPLNASGLHGLQLLIIDNTMINRTIWLSVEGEIETLLSCMFPNLRGQKGDTIKFKVDVTNPFHFETVLALDLAPSEEWEASILNQEREKINEIFLQGRSQCEVLAEVEIPENATLKGSEIILKATHENHTELLSLWVAVDESDEDPVTPGVRAKYPSQSIQLGDWAVYDLLLENTLKDEELFHLSIEGVPEGWEASFRTRDGKEIHSVLIDGGATEELTVDVAPSINGDPGNYSLGVRVESELIEGSITLNAVVISNYAIEMETSSIYEKIEATSIRTIEVEVRNTGHSPISQLGIEVLDAPTNWEVEATPWRISMLDPNQAETFSLVIYPPEATAPGDYVIRIRASGAQISSAEEVIRVTVTVESSWWLYGVIMMVAAVGVFAAIYLKFRRR